MDTFNEQDLYNAICLKWGENGAHADLFRDICAKAEIELKPPDTVGNIEDKIQAWAKEGHTKIQIIKLVRSEEYLGLREAKELVDRYV